MSFEDLNNDNIEHIIELWEIYKKEELYYQEPIFSEFLEELVICQECGNYELKDKMVHYPWDIGEIDDLICESCKENMSI